MTNQAEQFPTEAQRTADWQVEIIRRYLAGDAMSLADKKEARQLLKEMKNGA